MGMNSMGRNWSLTIFNDGQLKNSLPLPEGTTSIGRENSNVIVLPDSEVSRHHADIIHGPDGVSVLDLNSRNGIKVNGVPRQKAALQPGDRVEIGPYALELSAIAPAAPATVPLQQTINAVAGLSQ